VSDSGGTLRLAIMDVLDEAGDRSIEGHFDAMECERAADAILGLMQDALLSDEALRAMVRKRVGWLPAEQRTEARLEGEMNASRKQMRAAIEAASTWEPTDG